MLSVGNGIALVEGLPGVQAEEIIRFPGGLQGVAFNVDPTEVGVVLLGETGDLRAGDEARRTGRVLDVPVGEGAFGTGGGRPGASPGQPGPHSHPGAPPGGTGSPRHHGPGPGDRAPANGVEGGGRPGAHRPGPAGADPGGPADGQDRHCPGHPDQSKKYRRHLRLLRHRPAGHGRGPVDRRPREAGGHGLLHRGGGPGRGPAGAALRGALCRHLHGRIFYGAGPGRPDHL